MLSAQNFLTAIMDEAALRRPVGGPAAMCAQLEELLRVRTNVTGRIVPFTVGAFAGLEGAFTLLDFPAGTKDPDGPALTFGPQAWDSFTHAVKVSWPDRV